MDYEVAIAGAGPVGLLLACELTLAGVSVLVLESLADPILPIKEGAVGARALNIPSIEIFYRRALLPALQEAALRWTTASTGSEHSELAEADAAASSESDISSKKSTKSSRSSASHFGAMFDANNVDYTDPEFAARGPAAAYGVISMHSLESLLSERAAQLQVEIRRGTSLTDLSPDATGVTVRAGATAIRCDWLVGCDGGRSVVRKLAGFEFPGTDPQIRGYSA